MYRMGQQKNYTVYFTYDVNDHSLRFPLKADVEIAASGVYNITNIRQDHQSEGALLPPIRLCKKEGVWIFEDTENAGRLCAAIGAAIEEYQRDGGA